MRLRLLVLALLALSGCQLNSFHSTLIGETTVPGDDSGSPLTSLPAFGSFSNLDFAQNADFQSNGVLPSEINSAKVTSVKLEILSPSTQDFRFLDRVQFFARTGDTSTLIAEKGDLAAEAETGSTLSLDVTGVDLTPYLTNTLVTFEVQGSGTTPPQDTRLRATLDLEFRVKVV
jgi:hypothetical protein